MHMATILIPSVLLPQHVEPSVVEGALRGLTLIEHSATQYAARRAAKLEYPGPPSLAEWRPALDNTAAALLVVQQQASTSTSTFGCTSATEPHPGLYRWLPPWPPTCLVPWH